MRSLEAATLSRIVALVTLVERDEGMGPAMTAELGGILADRHGIPALLGMAKLVLTLCHALGEATDTDPAYIRQRLALIAAEAQ